MTVPEGIPGKTADDFVQSRSSWIEEKLAFFHRQKGPSSMVQVRHGGSVWLFGRRLAFSVEKGGAAPRCAGEEILLGEEWLQAEKLQTWLDGKLLERVNSSVEEFTSTTSLAPSAVRLGNARTRWGSCGISGRIMINRKLVHAPVNVVDYITFHELMHLRHRNHSSVFWRDLEVFFEGTSEAKRWLRSRGAHIM